MRVWGMVSGMTGRGRVVRYMKRTHSLCVELLSFPLRSGRYKFARLEMERQIGETGGRERGGEGEMEERWVAGEEQKYSYNVCT